MSNTEFLVQYIGSCFSGAVSASDCGPVWQIGIIAALLVVFIVGFVVLRMRGATEDDAAPR